MLTRDVRNALFAGLLLVVLAGGGLGWYFLASPAGHTVKGRAPSATGKPAERGKTKTAPSAAKAPPNKQGGSGNNQVTSAVYASGSSVPVAPPGYTKGTVAARNLPPAGGIRGIFLTGYVAGSSRMPGLITQLKAAGMNAVVINVKDDAGNITWQMNLPAAKAAGADSSQITNIGALLKTLKANHIYAIGRIVTFKDPVYAAAHPGQAVQAAGGGLWHDSMGEAWLDPYNRANWRYVVDVAKQAAAVGFQEIQFDYVRFPADGNHAGLVYPDYTSRVVPAEVISSFLRYADRKLAPYGVEVGADVFGLVTVAHNDLGIGQELLPVAGAVNIISPMTYPSLYANGSFGLANPALHPYTVVYKSVHTARLRLTNGPAVDFVPWIQDFSLWGVNYGAAQLQAQVRAVKNAGYNQWMVWNPACVYNIP